MSVTSYEIADDIWPFFTLKMTVAYGSIKKTILVTNKWNEKAKKKVLR